MGLISFLLVSPALLAAQLALSLQSVDTAGLDHEVTGPGLAPRILAIVMTAASLVLPVLTGRWARKTWLGYLLLGLALSVALGVVGLGLMGFL